MQISNDKNEPYSNGQQFRMAENQFSSEIFITWTDKSDKKQVVVVVSRISSTGFWQRQSQAFRWDAFRYSGPFDAY